MKNEDGEKEMKRYDILKDAPFEELEIPAPAKLETTEDYAELMQHLIAVYRPVLNTAWHSHGNDARRHLLTMMVLLTSDIMPVQYPDYVRNYPRSLDSIYALVGGMLVPGAERKAG